MAGNEPPTPKTHFAIMPAKPKGTLADYDAGNLPPPAEPKEERVSKTKRRKPNPPKAPPHPLATAYNPPPDATVDRSGDGRAPYERVLSDLCFRRDQINAAIAALKELYE